MPELFDDQQAAIEKAESMTEPTAVEAIIFTFTDSELVWTSDGGDQWPPRPKVTWMDLTRNASMMRD